MNPRERQQLQRIPGDLLMAEAIADLARQNSALRQALCNLLAAVDHLGPAAAQITEVRLAAAEAVIDANAGERIDSRIRSLEDVATAAEEFVGQILFSNPGLGAGRVRMPRLMVRLMMALAVLSEEESPVEEAPDAS